MKTLPFLKTLRHVAMLFAIVGLFAVAQDVSAQKASQKSAKHSAIQPIKDFAPSYVCVTDFTGDGQNDVVFVDPVSANWTIQEMDGTLSSFGFGEANDQQVAADYDGDGIIDIASLCTRDGVMTWNIRQSSDGTTVQSVWGIDGDVSVQGDYDGDGKTDPAVWRPSDGFWYINGSTAGAMILECGTQSDKAVPADFDGDGTTDAAVFRASERSFYFLSSLDQTIHEQAWEGLFRNAYESFVPADYDGDNKADFAIFNHVAGVWTILESSTGNYRVVVFEVHTKTVCSPYEVIPCHVGDYAFPADYDNDGMADPGVWDTTTDMVRAVASSSGELEFATEAKSGMTPVSAFFMTH